MEDLEQHCKAKQVGSRFKITTDGVFLWMVLLQKTDWIADDMM
jgi:hypothetical protein